MYDICVTSTGFIFSVLDVDLTLNRLIYLIKIKYPQVENDEIKIVNKGELLVGGEEKLTDLGVKINIDRLRIVPATIWHKFKNE